MMISSGFFACSGGWPVACGRLIFNSVCLVNVVEIMKKISNSSNTSTRLSTFVEKSISVVVGRLKRMSSRSAAASDIFQRFQVDLAIAVQRVDELERFLFHDDDQLFDTAVEEAMHHHRRNRHDQTRRRRDQRLGNATGEHGGIGNTTRVADALKYLHDTEHGADQTEHRFNQCNRAERIQITLHLK